jgi:hypothetical protein
MSSSIAVRRTYLDRSFLRHCQAISFVAVLMVFGLGSGLPDSQVVITRVAEEAGICVILTGYASPIDRRSMLRGDAMVVFRLRLRPHGTLLLRFGLVERFWNAWGCPERYDFQDVWPPCPRCRNAVPPGANYCAHCGYALTGRLSWPVCPRCKSAYRVGARRCPCCLCPVPFPTH